MSLPRALVLPLALALSVAPLAQGSTHEEDGDDAAGGRGTGTIRCMLALADVALSCERGDARAGALLGPGRDRFDVETDGAPMRLVVTWTPQAEDATALRLHVVDTLDRGHAAQGGSPLVLDLPAHEPGRLHVDVTPCATPEDARCASDLVRHVEGQTYEYAWRTTAAQSAG